MASGGLDDGERAPSDGSAEAREAATGRLDDGERAPSGGSAEAGAVATGDERAPPGGSDDHCDPPAVRGVTRSFFINKVVD